MRTWIGFLILGCAAVAAGCNGDPSNECGATVDVGGSAGSAGQSGFGGIAGSASQAAGGETEAGATSLSDQP